MMVLYFSRSIGQIWDFDWKFGMKMGGFYFDPNCFWLLVFSIAFHFMHFCGNFQCNLNAGNISANCNISIGYGTNDTNLW